MLSNEKPLSCVKMSKTIKVGVKTVHAWRHKFLAALNEVNPLKNKDEVELDEVYIPFCVSNNEISNITGFTHNGYSVTP